MIDSILILNFIFLCMSIAAITEGIKRLLEYFKKFGSTVFYKDVLLPFLPVLIGILLAIVFKSYPYPLGFEKLTGRIVVGSTAGLISAQVYRLFKALVNMKIAKEGKEE